MDLQATSQVKRIFVALIKLDRYLILVTLMNAAHITFAGPGAYWKIMQSFQKI